MNFRKTLITSGFFLGLLPSLYAGYTINRDDGGNNTLLVQGKEYSYLITNTNNPVRLEDVFIDVSTPDYDIFVAPGVQTGPNKYAVDSNGQLFISIRFHYSGNYSLTVENSQDSSNKGTLNSIQVQKYPTTYSVSPNNPTVTANVPFTIDITALDSGGQPVTAYEDPVQIVDSQLGQVTFVPGTSFVNGQAQDVSVTVQAADLNNHFDLTITMVGQQYYDPELPDPHLADPAEKVLTNLNLIPGPFHKYVMLFPGEILTPGSGKAGAVENQQSGDPVSSVKIYRVDSFFNPILNSEGLPADLEFSSSRGNVDNPPFPFIKQMTGPILEITANMNQIYFGGSGDVVVTVKDINMSGPTEEDTSMVPVTPGAAESYAITLIGIGQGDTITTDDIIQAQIEAFDQNGIRLSTLFGQVSGAQLVAHLGNGQESMSWVDTAANDLIPQNVVYFEAGLATVNLVVTKFGFGTTLKYIPPDAPSAESIDFNVDVGAPNKIHFTIVGKHPNPTQGQTWIPGTYPGNSGTPPTVTAGDEVVMEARITDKRWNLISGGGSSYTLQLVNNLPSHYIESRNQDPINYPGPIYTFPNNGEFAYNTDPDFDKAFRVKYRSAGPNSLVPSPIIKGTSNLSSYTCASQNNGEFCSSTATVNPGAYSKMAIVSGETFRPGIDSEPDGKVGSPTTRLAGVAFSATVYATDQYYNPIVNGPFPLVNFDITPDLSGSFVSQSLPSQMVSGSKAFTITLQESSDVQVYDNNISTINQTISIPVNSGPLHHLEMDNVSSPQQAGMAFTTTIRAEDQYGNIVPSNFTVDLAPNTGAGTMSPIQVSLVSGVFTGNLTMFASTPSAKITMSISGQPNATRDSNNFAINTNPAGYTKLLQLLPGETMAQGTSNGKTGTPTPATVGVVSIIKALACDMYYNPLSASGDVEFASNHYVSFGSAQGSLVNVDGHGEFSTTLILRAATTHNINVRDVNNDGAITRSTSSIQGLVGTYKKLQIVSPGEVADPGTFVPNGKTSAPPTDQNVAVPFNLTINAVDDFWNVVAFNGGDIKVTADHNSYIVNPPNNNGGNNPRPFVNGTATQEVIIGQQGITTLSVLDDANLTKPGQSVDLNVIPGPSYVFKTSPNATAGQPFPAVTITLEENGVPLNGYDESIFLSAELATGGPGSGNFNPDGSEREYVMNNGSVTITDLTYSYVERIRIKLRDNLSRVAYSNDIEVVPSGLKYRLTVPGSAIAGPPSTFDVTIELLEENTNTLVKNHDHQVDIDVVSAQNQTTDGQFTVTSVQFSQGIATFQQAYTKAESVIIRAEESVTGGDPDYTIPSRDSTNVNVTADGYKKLLIIAPGETHVPGVPSSTGKTGVPNSRQKGVAFLMQVRGVDQYWNVANAFSGGQILFTSDDVPPSLDTDNPSNQNAPLINGELAASMTLLNPGNVNVTVKDESNNQIGSQSVQLTVGGNYYQITAPSQEFSGPPTVFTMNATLIDFNTGLPITSANNAITIQAFLPDGSPAQGNLGVTSSNLVNGTVGITNQSYSIAENILIRVSDDNGDTGNSSVIQFIPRQIRYEFETLADAEVNVPFTVIVRTIDEDTGSQVVNLNRTNTLEAFSNGLPATGDFFPNSINIINGVGQASATYDKAEAIFLKMTDNTPLNGQSPPTQPDFYSNSFVVRPGPLASVEIVDFTMQSNETRTFVLICRDSFNNLIPNQLVGLNLISTNLPGFIKLNGQMNTLETTTNGQGEINMTFEPSLFSNGAYQILLYDPTRSNGFSRVLTITVQGFPEQPSGALGLGENRIPVGSTVFLDLNTQVPLGGTLRTFYRVNNSIWFTYDSATGILANDPNRSVPFFDTTREWTIEWYSEVCYDQNCSNPISELTVMGAPHLQQVSTYQLSDNLVGYPSPFNPKGAADENFITLQYPLAQASSVEIDIYDLFGQKVWHTDISAGSQGGEARNDNRVFWFGTNDSGTTVANGGYVVVVKVGATGQKMRSKILVAK